MSEIKSYTDIEQSKKLAEILPIESADMAWCNNSIKGVNYTDEYSANLYTIKEMQECFDKALNGWDKYWELIPCWSLAALLSVLPSRLFDSTPKRKELYLLPDLDKSYCFYRQFAVKTKGKIYLLTEGECLVDACVAMIEKLNELNLL